MVPAAGGTCYSDPSLCALCQNCQSSDFTCVPQADGTPCSGQCGTCQGGTCQPNGGACPTCQSCNASTFTCVPRSDGANCGGPCGTCVGGTCVPDGGLCPTCQACTGPGFTCAPAADGNLCPSGTCQGGVCVANCTALGSIPCGSTCCNAGTECCVNGSCQPFCNGGVCCDPATEVCCQHQCCPIGQCCGPNFEGNFICCVVENPGTTCCPSGGECCK